MALDHYSNLKQLICTQLFKVFLSNTNDLKGYSWTARLQYVSSNSSRAIAFTFESKLLSWPTVVEGDPKAPFSLATIRGKGESATPFFRLLLFTLDPNIIMLN